VVCFCGVFSKHWAEKDVERIFRGLGCGIYSHTHIERLIKSTKLFVCQSQGRYLDKKLRKYVEKFYPLD